MTCFCWEVCIYLALRLWPTVWLHTVLFSLFVSGLWRKALLHKLQPPTERWLWPKLHPCPIHKGCAQNTWSGQPARQQIIMKTERVFRYGFIIQNYITKTNETLSYIFLGLHSLSCRHHWIFRELIKTKILSFQSCAAFFENAVFI